jgi:CDP-glucose 4,6-dehydratase
LSDQLGDVRADIRDHERLHRELLDFRPEFVFHLAAQPLVRYSYQHPVETYETNVLGTVHVLEGLRQVARPCTAVIITTDKCYENREWLHGYREDDPMGGADPYSSSKGMAELAVAAYRRSYFLKGPVRVASVRAGNVIGGGDWALDRIVPDIARALGRGEPVRLRNPHARRPWQHVLDPLHGYLKLAALMDASPDNGTQLPALCSGFNFGPEASSNRTVRELTEQMLRWLPGSWEPVGELNAPHEATLLHLSIDKARFLLDWTPVWDFETAVQNTAEWYRRHFAQDDMRTVTADQVTAYQSAVSGNSGNQ